MQYVDDDVLIGGVDGMDPVPPSVLRSMLKEQLRNPTDSRRDCYLPLYNFFKDDEEERDVINRMVYEGLKKNFDIEVDIENIENDFEVLYDLYKLCVINLIPSFVEYLYQSCLGIYSSKNFGKMYPSPTYQATAKGITYEDYCLLTNLPVMIDDIGTGQLEFHLVAKTLVENLPEEKYIERLVEWEEQGVISVPDIIGDMYRLIRENELLEICNSKVLFTFWDIGPMKGRIKDMKVALLEEYTDDNGEVHLRRPDEPTSLLDIGEE